MIICRCEDVTLGELISHIENGSQTVKSLKLQTRAGMGICQGRTCRVLVEQVMTYYADESNIISSSVGTNFPIRPIRLAELAQNGKGDP
ncbi:(2Fe-2S)-binding protein [Oceanobacillus halotolerans]|uniref:(2Fe-2S)-binding protein n=1 Tax=Oceanobacillus halotolerans TaxID=2663380 RepID=UPI0013D9652F|nr:(2Fe-2S)-binding protein [Oceanobacillus halotolerans]